MLTNQPESIVVTGLGRYVIGEEAAVCDPLPYLRVKKLRKFMGVQDDLAVAAASRAVEMAGLASSGLGERAGLYWTTGYIPFERRDLESLARAATADGQFSMQRLSTTGFHAVNGLLTFQCLPNMPAFHISANFDLQGPYFVSYPGPGQFYVALEQAIQALTEGEIDVALVGGVAYQRNFLVQHHFAQLPQLRDVESLLDAAGCLVLERRESPQSRGATVLAKLVDLDVVYRPFDPFVEEPNESLPAPEDSFLCALSVSALPNEPFQRGDAEAAADAPVELSGPASLAVRLKEFVGQHRGVVRHRLRTRDGFLATSTWELP